MKSKYKNTKYINISNPLISIITPTYNRPDWLTLTLQSLVKQTYPYWECWVINDAGVSVKHVINELNDHRIKYYENSVNLDLAGSRNVAMKRIQGDWVITLDDDDGIYPDTLDFRLWRAKKLNADIVYSRVLQNFYEKTKNGYRFIGEKLYWDCSFNPDLLLVQNICPGNAIMATRTAYESGGIYDTELKTGEDFDHNISMSRHYSFFETKIIDCYCSYRTDATQMSGSRDFITDTIKIFKKWRHTAINLQWVIENQNNILKKQGINPADYGL